MDDLQRTREFFGSRAATWDERFPDDGPAFAAAVAELEVPVGGRVLDAGCGTGRALIALRAAVGSAGSVVAVDVTPEMLVAATVATRASAAARVLGDAARLPLRDAAFDGVLAAGLVTHFADPRAGLRALAAVTRRGGRLAVFHPIGRAALAERHGHALRADDVRAPDNIAVAFAATGWELVSVDDAVNRYLAIARRS